MLKKVSHILGGFAFVDELPGVVDLLVWLLSPAKLARPVRVMVSIASASDGISPHGRGGRLASLSGRAGCVPTGRASTLLTCRRLSEAEFSWPSDGTAACLRWSQRF